MNIFIHIGYHKTGTTYLQEVIFPKLEDVNFIWAKKNLELFFKLRFQDPLNFDVNTAKADFQKCMDGNKINLISSEDLSGDHKYKYINNKNIADKLHALFPRAKIIVTIRNQLDLLISMYMQIISAGGTMMSFKNRIGYKKGKFNPSYFIFDHRVNLEMFKFNNLINYYAEKFGKENILILLFEEFCQDKRRYLGKIFDFMGIKHRYDFDGIDSVINRSYGANQAAIARIVNGILFSSFVRNTLIKPLTTSSLRRLVTPKIKRTLKKILTSPPSFTLLGNKDLKVPDEIKHQIKSYYNESNRVLNEQYKLDLPDCYFL